MGNSVSQIKDFFSRDAKKVSAQEMMEFWKSCSEEERSYYQSASLA